MRDHVTLTVSGIESLAYGALVGSGASATAARSVAAAIARAEASGIPSHGLMYLQTYCKHLACGKVDSTAEPTVRRTAPSTCMVDAANGFAHPAIDAGFSQLVPLAREQGTATMAVFNSYNCGVLGHHVEWLAEAGLLGIGFTNAPASIAPAGGSSALVGTNPFAVAAPDGNGGVAILIDQSASVIAKSELTVRARDGQPIPEGWALNRDGLPTTDPEAGLAGTMVPSGGHKGVGMGLFVEIMAAALSGANLGIDAAPFSGTAGGPPGTGQCFIAMDVGRFSGAVFFERINRLCQAMDAQPGARVPGSRQQRNREEAAAAGVSVPAGLVADIEGLTQ